MSINILSASYQPLLNQAFNSISKSKHFRGENGPGLIGVSNWVDVFLNDRYLHAVWPDGGMKK